MEHRVENASTRTVRMVFHADALHRFNGDTLVMAPAPLPAWGGTTCWADGATTGVRPKPSTRCTWKWTAAALTRDLLSDGPGPWTAKGKGIGQLQPPPSASDADIDFTDADPSSTEGFSAVPVP